MRYAINPDNGMMYEADRGPWVRFADVEQQLAEREKQLTVRDSTINRLQQDKLDLLTEIARVESK
jgi:hypothetical protein